MSHPLFQIRLVTLIFIATMLNYFDRTALSYAILPIEQTMNLSDRQFGLIGSAFGFGYLLIAAFAGRIVDRFGSVNAWSIGALLWSAVAMGMGLASSFKTFFALRFLLGIAEGIHFPALLKTIADWLTPQYRARSLALSLSGIPLASLIGGPFVTFLIEASGWRSMFVILGLLGILWFLLWKVSFLGKKNPHLSYAALPFATPPTIPWKQFFQSRPFLANCLIYFSYGYVLFFAITWLPAYLEKTHGQTIAKTGFLVTFPWLISTLFLLAGGAVSDFLGKKTGSVRIARGYPIALGMALAALCFYGASRFDSLPIDLCLLSLGLGFVFAINAPIYALNADLFPTQPATAQGIMSCFFAFAGIVAPALTGWVVQSSGNFTMAILFVALLTLAAAFIGLWGHRKINLRI